MRLYRYIGPKAIAARASQATRGTGIAAPDDVARWARESGESPDRGGHLVATFVVDEAGLLRIAPRRSEHVACAGGGPVQSAGEMTFALEGRLVRVAEVSNQSTGYCPEPESWPAVEVALRRAGLVPPEGFSLACVFRRCEECDTVCLVKDGGFECGACGAELPQRYNCQDE
jgi:hypothetical protein